MIKSYFWTALCICSVARGDSLPSWQASKSKQAIVEFVEKVTTKGSPAFIAQEDRIATFDNDGSLWAEQPIYFQFLYAIDQVKLMANKNPEWKTREPFASIIKGDIKAVLAGGEKALVEIMSATHSGMTTEDFTISVKKWLETARHPKTGKPYTDMVYQPMLELLAYLRSHGFKTFIVSGGGIDFIRAFSKEVYGIPPEQVIGSSASTKYQVVKGKPVLIKTTQSFFNNDKEGKPVGIHQHIGKRPIFAAGNSDGDFQMLEYTKAGIGERFALIVHHDDNVREWAYDRKSMVGKLDRGLDEGPNMGWNIISMKNDWKVIYPSK